MACLDDVASIIRQVQFAWITGDDTGLSGMVIGAPTHSMQHLQQQVQPGLFAYGSRARSGQANAGLVQLVGGDGGIIGVGSGAPVGSGGTRADNNSSSSGHAHRQGLLMGAFAFGAHLDDLQYSQSFDISMSPRLDFMHTARGRGKAMNTAREHHDVQNKVVVFKDLKPAGGNAAAGATAAAGAAAATGATTVAASTTTASAAAAASSATTTTTATFSSPLASAKSTGDDAFARVPLPSALLSAAASPAPVSQLTKLLKSTASSGGAKNNYAEYSQYSGEGHVGIARTVKLEIFFPHAKEGSAPTPSMKVIALGTATVEQVIGLIMWRYTNEDRQPKLTGNMEAYCLRMVEDDGAPDMDFPALDRKQPVQKFGFDQLAFCEGPRFNRATTKRTMRPESKHTTTFVRVFLPNQGCSIVSVKSLDVLLKDILAIVRKKRQLPKDQHTLELVDAPGEELDLNQTLQSIGTTKFNLIHKFSKRIDIADAEEQKQRTETDDVDFSLTVHQYKYFFVYTKHKFASSQEVMLGIDSDKVALIPQSTQGFFAKQKLVSYPIDDVVACQLMDEKSKTILKPGPGVSSKSFRFVYYNGSEFKSNYLEAKSADEAKEIVTKLNYILQSRVSEPRNIYMQQQEEAQKKAKKT